MLVEGQKTARRACGAGPCLVTARADGRPSAAMLEIYGTEPKRRPHERHFVYRGNAHRQFGRPTPRAAETFAKADFIAAEDTRVTLKLLNHLGLKKADGELL